MKRFAFAALAALVGALALTVAGCGDDGSDEPTKVNVQVTEKGKGDYAVSVPSEIKGGAVELTLDNSTNQAPHEAQLIRLAEGHTLEEAQGFLDSNSPQEIPDWIQAYGGVGQVNPGETGTATVNLDEGHYVLRDEAENGAKEAPSIQFDVKETSDSDLPDTDASVTAATTGSDDPAHEYDWKTDGLKAGDNTITFDSQGEEALHIIVAAPIKGNATLEDVTKDLESNGPPQSLDFEKGVQTAIIDGDKKEVTKLHFDAGRYAFICFLPDRDEPTKPHYRQGLLKEVTIPAG
jgi:hypothetical protein